MLELAALQRLLLCDQTHSHSAVCQATAVRHFVLNFFEFLS
jgi:hypothetical protein